jgi:hypothetical protein
MLNNSSAVKQLAAQYSLRAYERELRHELTKLDLSFEDWRTGRISSGELSFRVHSFENGPFRKLQRRYAGGDQVKSVAYAIASGILMEDEVDDQVLQAIGRPLRAMD